MSEVSTTAVPRTRERILDVALDLFAEEGFSGTTITEVERRAGLSPGSGSFYRHFPSKEELLRAAVAREVERIRAEIAAARAASAPALDDPEDERIAGLTSALGYIRRYDRLLRLMFTEGDRVPELRKAITEALGGSRPGVDWDSGPEVGLALTALGGYHLFSLMQGRPFEDIPEADFIEAVARVIRP